MVVETSAQLEKNNGSTAGRLDVWTSEVEYYYIAARFRAFRDSGFCGVFLQRDFIFQRRVLHETGSDGCGLKNTAII